MAVNNTYKTMPRIKLIKLPKLIFGSTALNKIRVHANQRRQQNWAWKKKMSIYFATQFLLSGIRHLVELWYFITENPMRKIQYFVYIKFVCKYKTYQVNEKHIQSASCISNNIIYLESSHLLSNKKKKIAWLSGCLVIML